jgi:S1-C subfamily serine protease
MSTTLSAFSDQLADAVERAAGSVVSVHARRGLPSSGVHWRDGLVVTTDATVRRDQDIEVTLPTAAAFLPHSPDAIRAADLAVLRIAAGRAAVAQLGDPAALRAGHLVLALGRTGDAGPRAAFGAVSRTGGKWRSWKGGELDLLIPVRTSRSIRVSGRDRWSLPTRESSASIRVG